MTSANRKLGSDVTDHRARRVRPAADLTASTSRGLWQAAVLLCASGAAGLVYQVLWIKQLSLVVGVEHGSIYFTRITVSYLYIAIARNFG